MAGSINGIIIELRGNPSELRKELEKIETIAGNLNKKLENGGTHWSKLGSVAENFGSKIDKVGTMLSNLGTKLSNNVTNPMLKNLGDMIKTAGDLSQVFGTVTTGVGTLTRAIDLMKFGIGNATGAAADLAKGLQLVTTPTGLMTAGISAAVGILAYFATKETEAQRETQKFSEEMNNAKIALEEYNNNIDKIRDANLSYIDSTQRLNKELKELVDENGNVKAGEERRVKFILESLNGALDTEYKLNNNIIESYKDMQKEIDKLIEKKKAEIVLNSDEEKYKDAIQNQKQALEDLRVAKEKLGNKSIEKLKFELYVLGNFGIEKRKREEIQNIINSYDDAENRVRTYTENIKQYEENYEQFLEGNYEAISNTITETTKNWCQQSLSEISNSIVEQGNLLNSYKEIYESTGNELADETQKQAKANLEALANQLFENSKMLDELSPEQVKAWARLAIADRDVFVEKIKELNPEVNRQLKDIADAIDNNQEIVYNISKLSEMVKKTFTSHDSSIWGYDLVEGMSEGMVRAKITELQPAIASVSRAISSVLHFSKPDKGPLRDYETWMPDMIKGLANTLRQSTPILANEINTLVKKVKINLNIPTIVDFQDLNRNIMGRTKDIFVTPTINIYAQDELTPNKINVIIDTVNKRLGSKY